MFVAEPVWRDLTGEEFLITSWFGGGMMANFAWLTKDIAPSGVLGDPTPATAENGERWANQAAARIAEVLVAMYNFEPRHGA